MKGTEYVRAHTLPCSVGAIGHTTPAGLYFVSARSVKPNWLPPDEPWVGPDLRDAEGKPVELPFDNPRNPFAGGFISLGGNAAGEGVGFHGTKFDPLLGTRASHGCIRMAVPDLVNIMFKKVPDGTPVFIY